MINWFWQISHIFDTKLFLGDCEHNCAENISTCLLFILIDGTIARNEITAFLVTMIKQYKRPVLSAL